MRSMCALAVLSACSRTPPPAAVSDVAEAVPPVAAPMTPAPGSISSDPVVAAVHLVGRFDTTDPAAPRFSFSGSSLITRFNGTGVAVELESGGQDSFAVVVDGGPPRTVKPAAGRATTTLATGLPAGTHDLVLAKRTEAFVGTVTFHGFAVQGGALLETPYPFARSMEFIGDSITCGYGDEGPHPGCDFHPDQESEHGAWGAVAARALGAAHTSICYSGKGVIRNSGGGTQDLMSVIFQRTLGDAPDPKWDFARYQPEVVVINLGTNDWSVGDPGAPFSTGYKALLELVRKKYPRAFIVCAVGTMLGPDERASAMRYIRDAIDRMKDARVSTLDLGTQDPRDGIGCHFHPSLATHQKMGAALAAHLKEKVGW